MPKGKVTCENQWVPLGPGASARKATPMGHTPRVATSFWDSGAAFLGTTARWQRQITLPVSFHSCQAGRRPKQLLSFYYEPGSWRPWRLVLWRKWGGPGSSKGKPLAKTTQPTSDLSPERESCFSTVTQGRLMGQRCRTPPKSLQTERNRLPSRDEGHFLGSVTGAGSGERERQMRVGRGSRYLPTGPQHLQDR